MRKGKLERQCVYIYIQREGERKIREKLISENENVVLAAMRVDWHDQGSRSVHHMCAFHVLPKY